jgi:hypothetical protein
MASACLTASAWGTMIRPTGSSGSVPACGMVAEHQRKESALTVIAADSVTFVVGGLLYLILLITLGIISIRKGHWVMFIIGIFIPLFWLIGALLPPTAAARA